MLLRIQSVWSEGFFVFFFKSHLQSKNLFHTLTQLSKDSGDAGAEKKKQQHTHWRSVTYHDPYLSLTSEEVVKCITRDVSRAFYSLREWPVSRDSPMGLWWSWREGWKREERRRWQEFSGFLGGLLQRNLATESPGFLCTVGDFPCSSWCLTTCFGKNFSFWIYDVQMFNLRDKKIKERRKRGGKTNPLLRDQYLCRLCCKDAMDESGGLQITAVQ